MSTGLLCLVAACCWPSSDKDVTEAIKQCMDDDDNTAHTAMRTLAAQAEDDEMWAVIVMKVARKFGHKQWRRKDGQRTDAATQLLLLMDLMPLCDSRRALNASESLLSFARDEANGKQLRNALVVWNAFAGKFDVRVGSRMLTDEVLGFLMDNANHRYTTDTEVCMHALLALDKFSKTGVDNARRISELGYFERLEELLKHTQDHQLRLVCEWGLAHGPVRSAMGGGDGGAMARKRKRGSVGGQRSRSSSVDSGSEENMPGREKKSKKAALPLNLASSSASSSTTTYGSTAVSTTTMSTPPTTTTTESDEKSGEGRQQQQHNATRRGSKSSSRSRSRRRRREEKEFQEFVVGGRVGGGGDGEGDHSGEEDYEGISDENSWNAFEMDLENRMPPGKQVTLNFADRTNFIKLAADGYEIRNDSTSFGSIRANCYVSAVDRNGQACREGRWYYEVTLRTGGIMQVGWATMDSVFKPEEGSGIGDDHSSYAYDGCRRQAWHAAMALPCGRKEKRWKAGDVVGCLFDTRNGVMSFTLNGKFSRELGARTFAGVRSGLAFRPAISLGAFQQCRVNFGLEPFKFKPAGYRSVNDFATLYDIPLDEPEEDPTASGGEGAMDWNPENLHGKGRPASSSSASASALGDDPYADLDDDRLCKICYAQESEIKLHPCGHQEICFACSLRLTVCPVCRSPIEDREHVKGEAAVDADRPAARHHHSSSPSPSSSSHQPMLIQL